MNCQPLEVDDMEVRQRHWAIVDLVGKGRRVRTVPMPMWGKEAVDRWSIAAKISQGRIFRAVSRHGTPWGKGISENVIWYVVRRCAERTKLDHLAPYDLRSYAVYRIMPNRNLNPQDVGCPEAISDK